MLDEKNKQTSQVVVMRCDSYGRDAVEEAVRGGLELLGGAQRFAQPGEQILLKPNVLVGGRPANAISAHPAVLRAVARVLKPTGARLCCGDSPGIGTPTGALRRAGLAKVMDDEGIAAADFDHGEEVSCPDSPFVKRFVVAKGALAADGIVSVAKFKTHQLTRFTGAVKNQFGCVPGLRKAEYHVKMPDPHEFGRMLVSLNLLLRPRLCVMDGIVAMEGNGPRSGRPTPMNVLLLSADPVALDAVACRLIDLDPRFVPTAQPGLEAGLGTWREEEIELLGDPLQPLINPRFDVVRRDVENLVIEGAVPFARNLVASRPVIRDDRCSQCGICVQHCPVGSGALDWSGAAKKSVPAYRYRRCIRCFCCQELCPEQAIEVTRPLVGRLLFGRR